MASTNLSSSVDDIQVYRDNYIRDINDSNNKTAFVNNNADSLFALGLTMYSLNYSFDSLIYNAFASSSLDENISLHPEQRKVLSLIENNKGLVFSAPTSFGKTFIVFEYICRYKPHTVVMVVPTLALIDEYKQKIIKKYKSRFSEYSIHLSIDPDKKYDFSKKNIFIVTHDRVIDENIISIFPRVDFLVIDEVYKLQKDTSNDRVLILNIAYYNMVKISSKYVLLAPFIIGIENLNKLEDTPIFYSTNYSPVVNDVITYDIISEDDRLLYVDKVLNGIPQNENTLIYFPTVVEIDKYINNSTLKIAGTASNRNKILDDFISWGKREIHPEWSIIKALEKGFLVHHGQLPLGIRMLELSLFNDDNSQYTRLICTSTLLEGVNTTAKNIIISKPNRGYRQVFDAFDFYNLVGRTGRLYQHFLGIAHYIKSPNDPTYQKEQALKSIEFELTDTSIDMDINFGKYTQHPEFTQVLQRLNISYDEYKSQIARKYRFSTVKFLLEKYDQNKSALIDVLNQLNKNSAKSKLKLIRVLMRILEKEGYDFKLKTYIINRLTYLRRQSVFDVVEATRQSYPNVNVSRLINIIIRLKNSYIEFEFYSKVCLIQFFMKCDKLSPYLIDTLHDKLLKNIEIMYYINSPNKKMLKDMGVYDGDIDTIISVIGNDFSNITDLQVLLKQHISQMNNISVVSKFIIDRLVN